ncbi:MAG TPA: amidohydrolase [Hymenobacter sp.]
MRTLLAAALLLVSRAAAAQAPAPDIILTGGKVFTSDPARPYVQALAVRGERIVAVGSTADISKLAGPRTRRLDLRGRTVVPGFNDAHTHLLLDHPVGRSFAFPKAATIPGPATAQVLDTVAALARRLPPGTWLMGEIGLAVLLDPQARRADLDRAAPNHPVLLRTPWGHGSIVNSAALRQLRIADGDPNPLGGSFERLPGSGQLSGLLLEYGAWSPRRALQSQVPDSVLARGLKAYGAESVRLGITSVQNMAGSVSPAQTLRAVRAAQLPIRHRIIAMPMTTPQGINHREWAGVARQPAPLARVDGLKYILDATPLEGGALMRRPYPGRPGWYGQLNFPVDTVRQMLRAALQSPQQLMLHIAGDSTASLVLRLMSELADDATWRPKRVRFEHGDGVTADLQPRAKAMGVVVVQNPSHYINSAVDKQHAGPPEARPTFRSLLEGGVPFALGSDGPSNPYLNILFATTLADPKEALTREQAVRAYTAGSAYAEFQEKDKGTLSVGKLADLAVLSQDIFTVPLPALPGTTSELTMVGGKVVHEAQGGAALIKSAPVPAKKPSAAPIKPK